MAITQIARNFNGDPNIVTMVTDNTAAQLTTNGYLTSASSVAEIEALNNGEFEHAVTDLWLVYTSNGVGFYTYNSATGGFVALTGNAGLSSTLSSGNILVGNGSNVATGVVMSGDVTLTNAGVAAIGAGKVTLAKLSAGITPAAVIKYAGQVTTVGGSATEAFAVAGALAASDRAFVQIVDNGTNNVTVLQAVVTNNTLTVTFSGNPAADTILNYQLVRVAS